MISYAGCVACSRWRFLDRRGGRGRERLLLARDHFGIKPLLYAELGGNVLFASELKAMLASGVIDDEVDPVALWQLLAGGSVRQPRTMLKSVKMLPPAHRLLVDRRGARLQRYWSLGTGRRPGLAQRPFPEIVEIVDATLADAVASQLVADVPVGAFLSGGIDSALLVGLMTRCRQDAVRTFSVGFGHEGSGLDETDDAALVAAHFGTKHTRVAVTGAEVRDHIEKIARALDQPTVDGVNSYFISRAAAGELKVAISGTGSDEIFAGYPWFGAMHDHTAIARKRPLRSWLAERFSPYREDGFLSVFAMQYRIFGGALAVALLTRDMHEGLDAERSEARSVADADELPRAGVLERTSALVLRGYTVNQLLRDIDVASMAHSLEVRVPFLDVAVADLALSLPKRAKLDPNPANRPSESYRSSGIKRVLVAAARPMLPPNFDKRSKRGFAMPFGPWLRGQLWEVLHDCLSAPTLQRRGWFEVEAVRGLLERFEAGEEFLAAAVAPHDGRIVGARSVGPGCTPDAAPEPCRCVKPCHYSDPVIGFARMAAPDQQAARFEQDDFPGSPRILFVGDANSTHTRAWIELLDRTDFNVRLFAMPDAEGMAPPAELTFRIYVGEPGFTSCTERRMPFTPLGARMAEHEIREQNLGGRKPSMIDKVGWAANSIAPWRRGKPCDQALTAWLSAILRRWAPDIVHSFGIYPAGLWFYAARHTFGVTNIGRWVLQTRGGSDIQLRRFDNNRASEISVIANEAAAIITDNFANIAYMAEMGVDRSRFASINPVPGTGGIDVDALARGANHHRTGVSSCGRRPMRCNGRRHCR